MLDPLIVLGDLVFISYLAYFSFLLFIIKEVKVEPQLGFMFSLLKFEVLKLGTLISIGITDFVL